MAGPGYRGVVPSVLIARNAQNEVSVYFLRDGWSLTGEAIPHAEGVSVARTREGELVAVHVTGPDDLMDDALSDVLPDMVIERIRVWPGLVPSTFLLEVPGPTRRRPRPGASVR